MRRHLSRRRLLIAGGVWVALVAGSLGMASALNDEPAKPAVLVAQPPAGLPPLRLFLDRDPPKEVLDLPTAAAQADRLQQLAIAERSAERWVELGALAHRAGDLNFALAAYRQALSMDPTRVDAQVGVQMVDGATGPDGLARAAEGVEAIADTNPRSQLAAFNLGMVAVYRSDRPAVSRAFRRAVALDPGTDLGRLARQLAGASASAP